MGAFTPEQRERLDDVEPGEYAVRAASDVDELRMALDWGTTEILEAMLDLLDVDIEHY